MKMPAAGLAPALLAGAVLGAPPPGADLNLFQLTARADLVVHVRVREGALRYAFVDVLEAIKGLPPFDRLRIAFREVNFNRAPGEAPIVFPDGQEEILLLKPFPVSGRRQEKNRDLFELVNGSAGRITVPAEGARLVLDAVRVMAGIALLDPATQVVRFRELLVSQNPALAETALLEIERLHAATPAQYEHLEQTLRSPRSTLRTAALRVLAQVFAADRGTTGNDDFGAGEASGSIDLQEKGRIALAAVVERARNDADEAVRIAAVQAIGAWPDKADTDSHLRIIAASDSSQTVRYEAKRILFKRGYTESLK